MWIKVRGDCPEVSQRKLKFIKSQALFWKQFWPILPQGCWAFKRKFNAGEALRHMKVWYYIFNIAIFIEFSWAPRDGNDVDANWENEKSYFNCKLCFCFKTFFFFFTLQLLFSCIDFICCGCTVLQQKKEIAKLNPLTARGSHHSTNHSSVFMWLVLLCMYTKWISLYQLLFTQAD